MNCGCPSKDLFRTHLEWWLQENARKRDYQRSEKEKVAESDERAKMENTIVFTYEMRMQGSTTEKHGELEKSKSVVLGSAFVFYDHYMLYMLK